MAKASRALLQERAKVQARDVEIRSLTDRLAEATQLVEQLRDVDTRNVELARRNTEVINANSRLETHNAEIGQQLVDQGVKLKDAIAQRDRATLELAEARKAREAAEADNNFLRDSMHQLTIDKARLEGQLERVREFDPITEQRQYRDGLASIDEFDRGRGAMVSDGRNVRWYQRG